ncbi:MULTISPECIES: glycine C-acetyltransferase [unclassified Mesorhizobium]|uniref:glycine C-acetyltransferase n=1 Tax=unclassified Mesorhizobium TaxID=325217 RepID=UPI000FCA874E|nr:MULTISPECIES: glycine C-acetyltransferase [unclassified Mesorhizobium]RUU68242.1 glycine C-acetyltransferase [Mesorhizobium sp. M7A.T.Ca.TU.009.01.1.1]RUU90719.1 glycine C-acetyltransferase [Mesorhizobium sp. M7A.T.Ca.TU.009.01.1.2]RUT88382.1 glycine C-acetyltransferase [Mesorhizobium sp. M7A.T.Ca.US.000.02.1.1]RUT94598.1 glycine C-acetyltransferase [Mesorhizobium sp. M7A.T.Ca.US.000.02.2.1]RUU05462.1 glycine C-acetyltransferase [Mesorhizobium sp. M7A.T.Ca.TU.009.02.1.1]
MSDAFILHLSNGLAGLKSAGLYKSERVISSTQSAEIEVGGEKVLNFCANNYLGLADSPELREAAKQALDRYGYGMASVRFICGTQEEHKELEATISAFLGMDETILYGSCFDANGGLFEALFGEEDAIISDALNHASIIDGVRLSKTKRFRYANNDMAELEARLKDAKDCRFRLIATDGVFSMDGIIANLKGVCDLADKYDAMVMVDDSHAVGFVGRNGRGSAEHCGVEGRVDIITGTLGKALGGASGGYTSGKKPVVDWLRQRSRPYLFSNTLMPAIAGASLKVFELIRHGDALRERLYANAERFRSQMGRLGFTLAGADHPIIPVMLGDAALAQEMAQRMLKRGIYVIGFSFPVVPKGQARIRTQMSAAHSSADIDHAVTAFAEVAKELSII